MISVPSVTFTNVLVFYTGNSEVKIEGDSSGCEQVRKPTKIK
jgi:hypothetical protein